MSSMNPTEQRIFDIIRADVCGMCKNADNNYNYCVNHVDRCHAGYERQAKAINKEVVDLAVCEALLLAGMNRITAAEGA